MKEIERLSVIALTAVAGIGAASVKRILRAQKKHKLDWEDFWVLKPSLVRILGLSEKQIDSIKKFKKEYTIYSYKNQLLSKGIRVVLPTDDEYPPLLKQCTYAPLVLFAKGKKYHWKNIPAVAVVGTRQITAYGKLVTKKIVTELCKLESVIISGFMIGVDICAHQSAIETQGDTVAVLGYGHDHCYPADLREIMERWNSDMTFISPFAPHVAPRKGNFPARNRIVAGMSQVVVITEAASKSGSHITAGYAADEGRTVCAVPGPITSLYSEGTAALLNQGAVLVTSGNDVLNECGWSMGNPEDILARDPGMFTHSSNKILTLLRQAPLSIDEIANELQLHHTSVLSDLTKLELAGQICKDGWRWYAVT